MSEHTPLPWRIGGYCARRSDTLPKGNRIVSDRGDGFEFHIAGIGTHPGINSAIAKANADLIVRSVNSLPALEAENARLREQLDKAQAAVSFCGWLDGYFGGINRRDELTAFEANSIRAKLYGEVYPPVPLTDDQGKSDA